MDSNLLLQTCLQSPKVSNWSLICSAGKGVQYPFKQLRGWDVTVKQPQSDAVSNNADNCWHNYWTEPVLQKQVLVQGTNELEENVQICNFKFVAVYENRLVKR